jgi:uncharacterized protein YbjT (DUF2867 family)
MTALRKVFVAGSTGAVGRTVVAMAPSRGIAVVPHQRPRHGAREGAAVFELSDTDALAATLAGCTTLMQLIGTMRKRFAAGDTYETSDIGTTRQLVEGARRAGTIDHLILLSSVGAGKPMGAYLKAKAHAEEIVRDSGIPWTILRPSSFEGEGHHAPPGMATFTRLFGAVRWRPIRVEQLAGALLTVAAERAPLGEALEGRSLWRVVEVPATI